MDSNKKLPLHIRIFDVVRPIVIGGAAGISATTVIQPFDCIKVRMQLEGEGVKNVKGGLLQMGRQIVQNDGFLGLYRGYSAAFMRQAIYGSARMGLFRVFSDAMREPGKQLPFWKKTLAGLSSGALGATIGNPCDLTLVRMQGDLILPKKQRRNYKNFFHAVYRIIREEGILVLWTGTLPTIYRGMAMNVGMMTTYEQYKDTITNTLGDVIPSKAIKCMSSAMAGMSATLIVMPFDMIKTRMQKMKIEPGKAPPYTGFFDCGWKVMNLEGPLAFYKGFPAMLLRVGPHAVIALLLIESYHSLYDDYRARKISEM